MTGKATGRGSAQKRTGVCHSGRRACSTFLLLALTALLAFSVPAQAKEVIAYFGSEAGEGTRGGEFAVTGDVAVNSSGAGPAAKGDIYVIDRGFFPVAQRHSRIQRFAQNDNGTPANPYDDKYEFISAWGADVDSTTSGGSDYEICTVAVGCKVGLSGGGNGTLAGDGSLAWPEGIAVDQDTGEVYVLDSVDNNRVSVYAGNGTFLRSFGWDVVESGPDNAGSGYEVCIAAEGDICKAGASGTGAGQITDEGAGIVVSPADGNPISGSVYVSDRANHRIDTYNLDGTSPANFGSEADLGANGPIGVAIDSRGILYAAKNFPSHEIARYDTQNANGGGVGFLAPIAVPPLLSSASQNPSLEVDPDSDGAGPDTDVLYALRRSGGKAAVQQFGPVNEPGLSAPPVAADAEHGKVAGFTGEALSLGLDEFNGRLFISSFGKVTASPPEKAGVYVLDTAGGPPTGTLDSLSDITSTSATVHATVNPNGPPEVSYQLEYSTDGSKWTPMPKAAVGSQEGPQAIEASLDPVPNGLEPSTFYHVRMAVIKAFVPPLITAEKTFTTLAEATQVETVGAPVRTTTTAQLNGRVDPRNSASTYHFEYGSEGPCDANPCTATAAQPAGSGSLTELASEEVEGLEPNITYHYRLVGESAAPGSPSFGEDMTVTTRASDVPLSHGHFPGPPGSDRAYEMVSVPDSGGNPVLAGLDLAEDGNRALYSISGGTPLSTTGSLVSFYLAERKESAPHLGSWQTNFLSPPREELVGAFWDVIASTPDLSNLGAHNYDETVHSLWRLRPDAPAQKLFEPGPLQNMAEGSGDAFIATESPRTVVKLAGEELDPAFPGAWSVNNFYDVSSGEPKLASLLPNGSPPSCGVEGSPGTPFFGTPSTQARPLSDDGSRLFFGSKGNNCSSREEIYLRDFEANQTKLVSGPPISGSACGASLIRADEDVAFFWTQARLDLADAPPSICTGNTGADVYRYDIATETNECLTCTIAGVDADVYAADTTGGAGFVVTVSPDGSRIYFQSPHSLLPGAPATGSGGGSIYVLEVATGELRWVAAPGITLQGGRNAISHDGSVIRFRAKDPSLDPLGGTSDNGGTLQYYRYDDADRSLLCVSCPQDGSAPVSNTSPNDPADKVLSDDGDLLFATPTALLSADQNTPGPGKDPGSGTDVYEWRDGRLFLITDGLTNWPAAEQIKAVGIDRSGRDAFFIAPIQYTPDALDGYARLYDARIGGGFNFPKPPPPCPLEVCQGTPKGAPEEQAPGSGTFAGLGNKPQPSSARCPKGKRRVRRAGKARCVKPKKPNRASSHNRRAHR